MPTAMIPVPDFSDMLLTEANRAALEVHLFLTYYDRDGYPVVAPPQDQWAKWMVTQNMPPTVAGFQIMPGGQVGVIITFVPGN